MFLLVERNAASAIIQNRTLQSVEYAEGDRLAGLLQDIRCRPEGVAANLVFVPTDQGLYVLTEKPDTAHTLVFDLSQSAPFQGPLEEGLMSFQRAIRFAAKIWANLKFNPSAEHVARGSTSTKFIVFPLPYRTGSRFRLTLDRIRFEDGGDHLLVFKAGKTEGKGPDEIPSRSQFNIALAGLGKIDVSPQQLLDNQVKRPSLEIIEFGGAEQSQSGIAVPFESWIPLLTEIQRSFVLRPLAGPERLEGPAGTGKTLCLMLKGINTLRQAAAEKRDCHLLFVTHSTATRRAIEDRLEVVDSGKPASHRSRADGSQSLTVTTLQEWCGKLLGSGVSDVEYLDRDAAESKALQELYVLEALEEAIRDHLPTHKRFMSEQFVRFLDDEERWHLAAMFQHEIGVMIKGRARENIDKYRALPPIRYNLPLSNDADRGFVFLVYRAYNRRLEETGQFDTDDIVLSAMSQLQTPIWRRRRETEGYDGVLLDEAHLFNLNELSIVHYLTRNSATVPVAFAIDRSQAVGDRGVETDTIASELLGGEADIARTRIRTVFRSSPDILDLALAVTSSGATLFTNFENPLSGAVATFTPREEQFCTKPWLERLPSDDSLVRRGFEIATEMAERLPSGKAGVAIVVFEPALLDQFKKIARERNRPVEILDRRGDLEVVNRARVMQRFILAAPEHVGGLEFDGVILAGVDQGRVPPHTKAASGEARHFVQYAAHNLLYVAITRARYELAVLVNAERGVSEVLNTALAAGLLETRAD